jgi:diguanylate cyclase (GGDEF)-like protein/putative nucleotidyltransferase with HDIG domain
MRWQDHTRIYKFYVFGVYLVAIPFAIFCLRAPGVFSIEWALITLISLFVATINIRLPKLSAVISMGDVLIILVLTRFGPGPALVTYWIDTAVAGLADLFRRHGLSFLLKIRTYRWIFNFASCALSTWAMYACYSVAANLPIVYPVNLVVPFFAIAAGWFVVNTGSLSLAFALELRRSFLSVWSEGVSLYLLNFFGSAAVAGLISLFYARTGVVVFIFSAPIAVVLYQLYSFSVEKYDQAQKHIGELNTLYLQTVEALASAVDAKDRYTHGHVRRVQAYASELAVKCGINDEREMLAIQAGALLHDIGKIAIPEYILNKPTTLTETEYEKMKIHPTVGANMLSTIDFPYPLIPLVKSHHERWDGNGYPDGLRGTEIPLSARILAVADCYDALTTNRPYRAPMSRETVVEFFRRESGRAYDPNVVQVFIENIKQIEAAGNAVDSENTDVWGIKESVRNPATNVRPLERVQPIVTYGKALSAEPDIQRELYSVFEFVRADFHCLTSTEIFSFMGRRLSKLIDFDTAVFYAADLTKGIISTAHSLGEDTYLFDGLNLLLEQKLSGWVAANNQSLCNLPPFPDFLNIPEPKPAFQISAIAPMNRHNEVLGAISLYRKVAIKFTDEEFRRLEIVAAQAAVLVARCSAMPVQIDSLTDGLTNLPNGFQLYLMFDRVMVDADRYEYPLALLSIHLEDIMAIRQQWGHLSGDEAIRTAASYLSRELRETDLLVRYAADEFIAVNPKMSREQAENLKSRLQNELDHLNFAVRAQVEIPLRVSIGISIFPEDGTDLETILAVSALRTREDRDLRSAAARAVRQFHASK